MKWNISNKVGATSKLFFNFWILLINIGESESRANRCKKTKLVKIPGNENKHICIYMHMYVYSYMCKCMEKCLSGCILKTKRQKAVLYLQQCQKQTIKVSCHLLLAVIK